jgi:predicted dithiol-disulfide oxidoreductase (DUF899 family)
MQHPTATREEWLAARNALMIKEKARTRLGDAIAAERRALPWVRIEKEYGFDSQAGKVTLSDLFDGRSQLFTKTFMLSPGQQSQCVGCSLECDHMAGIVEHLNANDVSYAVIASAPLTEIEVVRQRMGWTFNWVSSFGTEFNREVVNAFSPTGHGVGSNQSFYKDEDGQVFLTYGNSGRGGEGHMGIYAIFDQMAKGRNENGPFFSMTDWVRPRNMYGQGGTVEGNGEYRPADCGCGEPAA